MGYYTKYSGIVCPWSITFTSTDGLTNVSGNRKTVFEPVTDKFYNDNIIEVKDNKVIRFISRGRTKFITLPEIGQEIEVKGFESRYVDEEDLSNE